jgi:hypothetical protein
VTERNFASTFTTYFCLKKTRGAHVERSQLNFLMASSVSKCFDDSVTRGKVYSCALASRRVASRRVASRVGSSEDLASVCNTPHVKRGHLKIRKTRVKESYARSDFNVDSSSGVAGDEASLLDSCRFTSVTFRESINMDYEE